MLRQSLRDFVAKLWALQLVADCELALLHWYLRCEWRRWLLAFDGLDVFLGRCIHFPISFSWASALQRRGHFVVWGSKAGAPLRSPRLHETGARYP